MLRAKTAATVVLLSAASVAVAEPKLNDWNAGAPYDCGPIEARETGELDRIDGERHGPFRYRIEQGSTSYNDVAVVDRGETLTMLTCWAEGWKSAPPEHVSCYCEDFATFERRGQELVFAAGRLYRLDAASGTLTITVQSGASITADEGSLGWENTPFTKGY